MTLQTNTKITLTKEEITNAVIRQLKTDGFDLPEGHTVNFTYFDGESILDLQCEVSVIAEREL